jgi:hypothetical protein
MKSTEDQDMPVRDLSVTSLKGVVRPPSRPISLEEMDEAIVAACEASALAISD